MSAPSADFLFPRPIRRMLWIAGGLIFYAQLTIGLLRDFEIYSPHGTHPVSAWITLANLVWNAPAQIYTYEPNAIIMDARVQAGWIEAPVPQETETEGAVQESA